MEVRAASSFSVRNGGGRPHEPPTAKENRRRHPPLPLLRRRRRKRLKGLGRVVDEWSFGPFRVFPCETGADYPRESASHGDRKHRRQPLPIFLSQKKTETTEGTWAETLVNVVSVRFALFRAKRGGPAARERLPRRQESSAAPSALFGDRRGHWNAGSFPPCAESDSCAVRLGGDTG
jgi:hypothetical protein